MPQTMTQLQQINTVMVPVGDLDRAIDFYVETLGFEKRVDIPFGEGERWVEVGLAGTQTSIALTPQREPDWPAGRNTGISFTTADIDALHARLRDTGVDVDEQVMRMGDPVPPMFWFRDADANVLLVVAA